MHGAAVDIFLPQRILFNAMTRPCSKQQPSMVMQLSLLIKFDVAVTCQITALHFAQAIQAQPQRISTQMQYKLHAACHHAISSRAVQQVWRWVLSPDRTWENAPHVTFVFWEVSLICLSAFLDIGAKQASHSKGHWSNPNQVKNNLLCRAPGKAMGGNRKALRKTYRLLIEAANR